MAKDLICVNLRKLSHAEPNLLESDRIFLCMLSQRVAGLNVLQWVVFLFFLQGKREQQEIHHAATGSFCGQVSQRMAFCIWLSLLIRADMINTQIQRKALNHGLYTER